MVFAYILGYERNEKHPDDDRSRPWIGLGRERLEADSALHECKSPRSGGKEIIMEKFKLTFGGGKGYIFIDGEKVGEVCKVYRHGYHYWKIAGGSRRCPVFTTARQAAAELVANLGR